MPYVNRTPLRIVRRRGFRGLGDAFSYGGGNFTVTFIDQNGATLPFSALSSVEQSQAITACAASEIFGQPSGASLTVHVNGAGSAQDLPSYTLSSSTGGYTLPATPAGYYQSPIGQEIQRASMVLNGTGPAPVSGPSGGVVASSLPANFQVPQVAPTAAQVAAAFGGGNPPSVTAPSVPAFFSGSGSSSTSTSTSSGIPLWVWLVGGGLVLFLVMGTGGKK